MTYSESSIKKLVNNPLLKKGDELICVDTSTIDELDILPAYADIKLGQYYDFVDFDDTALIDRMRNEGMSDQDIAQHKFILSSELEYNDGKNYTEGRYDYESNKLLLYPLATLKLATNSLVASLSDNWNWDEAYQHKPLASYSASMSETAYHEIRHMKQHISDDWLKHEIQLDDERDKIERALGATVGALVGLGEAIWFQSLIESSTAIDQITALGIIVVNTLYGRVLQAIAHDKLAMKRYFNNPVEVDARSVEYEAPSNAVTLQPKEEYTSIKRKRNTFTRRKLFNLAYNAASGNNLALNPDYDH